LCADGSALPVTRLPMPVTCLRVLRQMPHPVPDVCAVLMRGAAVRAPLGRAYARTKLERVGRSGRGHRGCIRLCLSRAGVLGSLIRPAVRGIGRGFRSKIASEAPADRVDAAIGSLPHRVRLAKQDSSVTRNTHLETNAHHVLSGQGSTQGRQKLATRRSYNLCAL